MKNSSLGERILYARHLRGMTLDAVAQAVGVHKSTIQRYEKDEYASPKLPVIESIARALSVNPSWLVGKSDDMWLDNQDEKESQSEDLVNGDPELTEILTRARDDPHIRMLFSVTKDAKPEDIEMAIQIIQRFKGE